MDGAPPPPAQGPPPMRGSFRSRGGPPMRGFDRVRGRGMGRGGPMMGSRGGMGGPPMMRGRGGMMRGGPPRGMGFQRGCPPRGIPMRGGRPPMHSQQPPPSQPPPPAENSAPTSTASSSTTTAATTTTTVQTTSSSNSNAVVSSRGGPRGRGVGGRGRGSYIPSTNGTVSMSHDPNKPPPMGKPYRGGPPRGRGGFGQGISRPLPPHSANTQVTPVPTLKRGAPTGPPGPKRGRYDQAPVNRQLIPKHHPTVQTVHPTPHAGYGNASFNHHAGYQNHDQMQTVDQYSQQAYAAPPPQSAYNGYAQTSYGSAAAGYPQGNEYDQSQYQSYNASAYNQQDTRYQGYAQDYSQTYGAPAVDYTAPPPDYSQQTQAYDDRSYAGYDTQAYNQGYANATGYY